MKTAKKKIEYFCSILVMVMLMTINAKAADFNTSVTSADVTQGENVTVTVTFSSDVEIGGYNMSLTYDAAILEYVSGADGGGGGSLRLYNDILLAKSETRTITFKAKAAGTTTVSVVNLGGAIDTNADDLNVKVSSGTIKVNAPVTTSSNNNLASLSIMAVRKDGSSGIVELAPVFSKDVTEYNLWLGSEFNKLSLSANAEDAKAKVAVAGTELKGGDNVTTITVTAENGTQKTYKITTHVKLEETTTPETVTEAPEHPSVDEPQKDNNTDENRKVTISGKNYIIIDVTDETALPEGFEKSEVLCNGITVSGASDLSKTLTLLYLMNEETNENHMYIYDEKSNTYTQFLSYNIAQRAYIILNVQEDFEYNGISAEKSNELELAAIELGGGYSDVYKLKNVENVYIVRAMNWDNKIYYYYYNSIDGSMLPYFGAGETFTNNGGNADQSIPVSISEDEREAFEKRIEKRNVLIIVMGIFMVMQIITLIYVIFILTKKKVRAEAGDEAATEETGNENGEAAEGETGNENGEAAEGETGNEMSEAAEEKNGDEKTDAESEATDGQMYAEEIPEAETEKITEEAEENLAQDMEKTDDLSEEKEVTPETEVRAEGNVETERESEAEVKAEVKAEAEVQAETEIKAEKEKETESKAEINKDIKTEIEAEPEGAATPEEIDKAIDDIVSQLFK